MTLPAQLQDAITTLLASHKLSSLTRAAEELSDNYRRPDSSPVPLIRSDLHRLAYLAVRLPATFAAVHACLMEVRQRLPHLHVRTMLDLGAGPGTAAWAAVSVFAELQQITLLERDREMLQLAQSCAQQADHAALRNAEWQALDYQTCHLSRSYDLVVCSYALGESEADNVSRTLPGAWQSTDQVIVIIEPGTVRGFGVIRCLREELINLGGHLVAPCPHQHPCPMTADDWCHFAQRCDRSALHRQIKQATLGYEDEKYTWVAAAKDPVPMISARVIRHPLHHTGYAKLALCTQDGLTSLTVTRKNKEQWRRARKIVWGDVWE